MKNSSLPSKQPFSQKQAVLKTKIAALFCIFYALLWYLDLFTIQFAFTLISLTILTQVTFYLEKNHEDLAQTIRSLIAGAFPGLLVILMPKFHLLGLFSHADGLHFSVRDLGPKKMPTVLLTNVAAWIVCYISFYHSNSEDKPYIFADLTITIQFFVCIVISYCFVIGNIFDRKIEIDLRAGYESKLLALNTELEDMNVKLQTANKRLQEALEEKENFLLRFSHEIRNPLNSLLGNVELCCEYAKESELKLMLKEAKISGEILLQLLNNVLDTAKVSTGKLDLSVHSQSIREFLERAWVVTSEIIRKKGLFGCLSINVDAPDILDFDNHRVMQVLINTISNATKFTEHGFVKVFVDFEEGNEIRPEDMKPRHTNMYETICEEERRMSNGELWAEDISENPRDKYDCLTVKKKKFSINRELSTKFQLGFINPISVERGINNSDTKRGESQRSSSARSKNGFIRFEIIDSGCGIKKADLESLFTKFKQVNQETSKRQVGTGLGLWITKEIIELMEGKIEIYSVPNRGTVLVIMLKSRSTARPVVVENKLERTSPKKSLSAHNDSSNVKRILILEDIPDDQEINGRFRDNSDEVGQSTVANNGRETIDLAAVKEPRKTVLLADDDSFNLAMMSRMIKICGYEPLQAQNGAAAVQLYEKHWRNICAIFMDFEMPVMDGWEATKAMLLSQEKRSGDKGGATQIPPIYGLTGHVGGEYKQKCIKIGMKGVLEKPITIDRLKKLLCKELV